jgi:hypothetical protein
MVYDMMEGEICDCGERGFGTRWRWGREIDNKWEDYEILGD